MAYKKINATDAPKRSRISSSRFERTPDWRAMQADLEKGLKPNEVLQIMLTEEDKKRYGIKNRRTVARFLKKYLEVKKLPYAVKSFSNLGRDFVLVQYTPRVPRP
jgi:hypothetical protein